jgi:hypothetical protein
MKTLSAIVSSLQQMKGTGRWREIADSERIDYDTIARIARGSIKAPSIVLCERISNAIDRIESPRRRPSKSTAKEA